MGETGMRLEAGQIYLSASDLMRFQGCSHATALDVRYLQGEPLTPVEDSADAKLVQEKGSYHNDKNGGLPCSRITLRRDVSNGESPGMWWKSGRLKAAMDGNTTLLGTHLGKERWF